MKTHINKLFAVLAWILMLSTEGGLTSVRAAEWQKLHGNVPEAVGRQHLKPIGRLSTTNRLNLSISLPLRNQEALTNLLQQIYDPASTNYHHYLNPEQFTEMFGPTESDYQAVIAFAKANGLLVTGTHPNRTLLDVSGKVPDVEKVFHVTMQVYQHPHEVRKFYAPDVEPSVDLAVPVLHVTGMNNFELPHPVFKIKSLDKQRQFAATTGSGPSGNFMGIDFRNAYAPGVTLNGSGQTVALFEMDGYYTNDILYYEQVNGLPNVALTNVLLGGFNGIPVDPNAVVEVSLDIEMAIAMAPGLSQVMVYEAPVTSVGAYDILNQMATDNHAKQISSSWVIDRIVTTPVPNQIYLQYAAQGQSFLQASGDQDAYVPGTFQTADSPYITTVGGTTLTTTGPGGSYVAESVWQWGGGNGSGGGISTSFTIPTYQQGINMTTNLGSTIMRNVPDVALTSDNVYVRAGGADYVGVGGTSCAAPLWAGFMALVNQQAAASGQPTVGFINPAVYALAQTSNYTNYFHDVVTGNNTNSSSHNLFFAAPGYDLCTGWGTPAGQKLINALSPQVTVTLPLSATEGDGLLPGAGLIQLPAAQQSDVLVGLTSSNPARVAVPANITLFAGQSNAVFELTILDDGILDGTQPVTITASVPATGTGSASMTIFDKETATLQILLPPTVIKGQGSVQGSVQVSAPVAANVSAGLISSNTNLIQIPAAVIISSGQTSAVFTATILTDGQVNGGQTVNLTAHVQNWTDGTTPVMVQDNVNLTVTLPASAWENAGILTNAGAVSASGVLSSNLLVTLSSGNLAEVTVPSSAIIFAGTSSSTFNITVVDNGTSGSNQTVTITASATGYTNGSATLQMLNDQSPPIPSSPQPGNLATNVSANTNLMWNNGIAGTNQLVLNGGFETGTFTNWSKTNSSTAGDWVINNGTYVPPGPGGATVPFAGSYSAVSEQTGAGTHTLYQDITISSNTTSATLAWTDRIRNFATQFTTNSQYFHVEIRGTNNAVLQIAFSTKPGDPLTTNWVTRSFNLSSYIGQKIRVVFVESDSLGYFNVGLDNISVQVNTSSVTNAPGILNNDVYFGTNPTPGPAEYQGTTTNSSWQLPLLSPQTTYYWQIVANRGGSAMGPVWQFTTAGVDHFGWNPISSPQFVGQPFGTAITAQDAFNQTVSNFTGQVSLAAGSSGGSTGAFFSENFESGNFSSWVTGAGSYTRSVTSNTAAGGNYSFTLIGGNTAHYDGISHTLSNITPSRVTFNVRASATNVAGGYFVIGTGPAVSANAVFFYMTSSGMGVYDGNSNHLVPYVANQWYKIAFVLNWTNKTVDYYVNDALAYSAIPFRAVVTSLSVVYLYNFNSTQAWWDEISFDNGNQSSVITLSPTNSGNFVNGLWSGNVTVLQPATNVVLQANDGHQHTGFSNPFDVDATNDIAITATATPSPVSVGATLTYTLTVTNTGPADATGVNVTNLLPANITFVSAVSSQGSCTQNGNAVTCNLGVVPGATNATITLTVVPTIAGTTLTNVATVSRAEADNYSGNNLATTMTPVTTPTISIADAAVVEGNLGTTNMIFAVTLAAPSTQTITVNYATSDGSATAGSDYVATNGTLTFPSGITNGTISVAVIGDVLVETNETFLVNLSNPVNGTLGRTPATGTIINDDGFPGNADHFIWSAIASPQFVNQPFNVTITALDASNNVATNFNQTVVFSSGPASVIPGVSDIFTNGVWVGNLTISQRATNLTLRADDGNGHFGLSNPFDVAPTNMPPVILLQPTSLTVVFGGTAVFSIAADGTPPLIYQWNFHGTNILGATNTTLVLNNVQFAQAGNYSVQVANNFGSTNSNPAALTVNPLPPVPVIASFTPQSGTVGTTVTLSGYNFSPTTSANIVFFGGVQAIVVSASPTSLQVTVPVGATFAPIAVTVNGLTAYANQPFLPTFTGTGQVSFALSSSPGVGAKPLDVVAVDVNGDGKADLICANAGDGNLSILTNNGSGGFVISSTPSVVNSPYSVNAVDFNGDGKVDLASENLNGYSLSVLTNSGIGNYLNSFAITNGTSMDSQPYKNTAADINGDGRPDLITANYYNSLLSVLTNNGSGGFANAGTYAVGNGPDSVVAADVNGDGKMDLICANNWDWTLSVLTNNGSGGFALSGTYAVGRYPASVIAADVNKDGKMDLICANQDDSTLSVLTNTGGGGFATAGTYAVGGNHPVSVVAAELSGDGNVDLITANSRDNTVSILTNSGTGSFVLARTYSVGSTPWSVVAADVNGDGKLDLITANSGGNTLSILTNATPFSLATIPIITAQPTNQTVTVGGTAAYSISATGSAPLSYIWQRNGSYIAGATNSAYSTNNVQLSDSGSQFSCVVSNAYGMTNSQAATLTVIIAPTITVQPANVTVNAGQPATFNVTAMGTAPLHYQWQFGAGAIAGANSSSYTITSTVFANTGSYSCVVSNSAGSTNSQAATLTVISAPTITVQPANVTVNAGQPATFNVTATGTAPLYYQWQFGGGAIAGATNSSYTIASSTAANTGSYSCVVTNSAGSTNSQVATLTVNIAPTITMQPANVTVNAGQPATFSVTATGTAPLHYQWQFGGAAIPGANSSSYTISSTVFANAGSYSCVVSNSVGSIISQAAMLTVYSGPIITVQPTNAMVAVGQPAAFSVTAVGTAPLYYQWQFGTGAIAGATNSSYTIASAAETNSGNYSVVVTNAYGSVTSSVAVLQASLILNGGFETGDFTGWALSGDNTWTIVDDGGSSGIAPHSGSYEAALGTSSSLGYLSQTVATTPGTSYLLSFWLNHSGGDPNDVFLVSWNGTTLIDETNPPAPAWTSYQFMVMATGTSTVLQFGYEASVTDYLGLDDVSLQSQTNIAPMITLQPTNVTLDLGQPVTFSVAATGTAPIYYQWLFGGVPIAGANSSSYSISSTTVANAGNYFCLVSNSVASTNSQVATLTFFGAPIITMQPTNLTVNLGQPATFSVRAVFGAGSTNTDPLRYQWQFGGVAIAGATGTDYTIASTVAANAGSYNCVVSNSRGKVTSATATLTVYSGPIITVQPTNVVVTVGAVANFSVTATGSLPLSYFWMRNGTFIAGATNSNYTANNVQLTDTGSQFSCVVSNAYGMTNSQAATLTVNIPPTITMQPANVTVNAGQPATFSVTATGTAPLHYQWQFGGAAIAGATNSSYTIANTVFANGGSYSCVVSNNGGSTNSQTATLTVISAPTITMQPENVVVKVGQPATFSVTATGTAPLYYQWQFGGGAIAGATNSSYTITNTTDADIGSQFSCVVSNAYGSLTSSVVTLQALLIFNGGFETGDFTDWVLGGDHSFTYVDNGSVFVPHSGSYNALMGNNTASGTLSQTAATTPGTPYLLSCWFNNSFGDPGLFRVSWNGSMLLNETNPATTGWTNYQFIVVATQTNTLLQFSFFDNAASFFGLDDVSLQSEANLAPIITVQPTNMIVKVGQPAVFSVTAVGTAPLYYQWLSGTGAIAGATNSSYTIASTVESNSGNYSVVVTNAYGSVTSSVAVLQASLILNSGFETGDFAGWTLSGDNTWTVVDDGNNSGIAPHAGSYEAALGTTSSMGYLSQTVATTPGTSYLLSCWLNHSGGDPEDIFIVSWNGITLLDETNPPAPAWTNYQFVVTATGTSTVLQFGYEASVTDYLGLDDVSLVAIQPPIPYLQGQWLNQQLILSWTNAGFSLQTAPSLPGTFTNIPGATSPYTNPATGSQQFFRLMQ
jgi:uncharacterized repeat protein (TIGR01451 family)